MLAARRSRFRGVCWMGWRQVILVFGPDVLLPVARRCAKTLNSHWQRSFDQEKMKWQKANSNAPSRT
jgi:hypothetical protein